MKKKLGFDRNRLRRSAAAAPAVEELVRFRPAEGGTLPVIAEPAVPDVDLAAWAEGHKELIEEKLREAGAVLFRGFGIDTAERLEDFAGRLCDDLFNENAEHPRDSVSGNVYTPVFYPPEKDLIWHNENSFNPRWPRKIFFACGRPAASGGSTPVVDSREVYRRLPEEARRNFEEKGVCYVRSYGGGMGLDWRTVFRSDDREVVEERCREEGFEWEWREGDRLRTRCTRPAVIPHPDTGEPCFFGQPQHWHVACLEPEVRRQLEESLDEEDLPRHAYYGDGSPIPDEVMEELLAIYAGAESSQAWQKGDVMLVDNVLAAHGRKAFTEPRKIYVALGGMTYFDA